MVLKVSFRRKSASRWRPPGRFRAAESVLIHIALSDKLAPEMDKNPDNNIEPKHRRKLVVIVGIFMIVLVGVVVGLVFELFEPTAPITIRLSRPIPRSSPEGWARDVLVPTFEITNVCDRSVFVNMWLECQSNDVWIGWPQSAVGSSNMPSPWQQMLNARVGTSTFPTDTPANTTSNLLRVHGFASKELAGLPNLRHRLRIYLISRGTDNATFKKMAFDPNSRAYPPGTEFVTSAFYLTNEPMSLRVTMGNRDTWRLQASLRFCCCRVHNMHRDGDFGGMANISSL
jgi:hypothetical protein